MANNPRPLPPFLRRGPPGSRRRVPAVLNNPPSNETEAPGSSDPQAQELERTSTPPRQSPFHPTHAQVRQTRKILSSLGSTSSPLPIELVDLILDFASYYPVLTSHRTDHLRVATVARLSNKANLLYLISHPFPSPNKGLDELIKPKSVQFTIISNDQGWGGLSQHRGTYEGSWTWFVACILRPNPKEKLRDDIVDMPEAPAMGMAQDDLVAEPEEVLPLLEEKGWEVVEGKEGKKFWHLQRNVCASRTAKKHVVEWKTGCIAATADGKGDGEGFVELMQPGDRIGVWARALYPGWVNDVQEVKVEMEYSI